MTGSSTTKRKKLPGALVCSQPAHRTVEVELSFLTPVFGGGVQAQKTDPVTPARAASIRGQLRFWWRAINPAGCSTWEELLAKETALFGGVHKNVTRSRVELAVIRQLPKAEEITVFENGSKFRVERGKESLAYGAFPLRATGDEPRHGVLYNFGDSRATLQLRLRELMDHELREPKDRELLDDLEGRDLWGELKMALWAFGMFGGLGARTRRGFGAVHLEGGDLPSLKDGWNRLKGKTKDAEWPQLHKGCRYELGSLNVEAHRAHTTLLKELSTLRQGFGVGRKSGPGRSYWPEPDTLRVMHKRHSPQHKPADMPRGFPRAKFGLPIQVRFHSKDPKDPSDFLQAKGSERWASPLIIRPIRDGDKVRPLALELDSPLPALALKSKQGNKDELRADLSEAEASGVAEAARERGFKGDPKMFSDPIGAYLDQIREKE